MTTEKASEISARVVSEQADEALKHNSVVYDFKQSYDAGKEIAYVGLVYVTGMKERLGNGRRGIY